MSNGNSKIAMQALERAKKDIMAHLARKSLEAGFRITEQALREKSYNGFTGNAQTSYTALVYNAAEVQEYSTGDNQRTPIRGKIPNGETVFLPTPYEGSPRKVRGKVDILNNYSSQTIAQIKQKPVKNKGVTMRLAVGVEYNNFIGSPIDKIYSYARALQTNDFK